MLIVISISISLVSAYRTSEIAQFCAQYFHVHTTYGRIIHAQRMRERTDVIVN